MTAVLHLCAAAPDPEALGGVSIHVAALASHMAAGADVFTAHPGPAGTRVQRWTPGPRLEAVLDGSREEPAFSRSLAAALAGTGASVLFVHSPMLGARAILRAVEATGVRLVLSIHDGALACENHELLENGMRFCGVPADLARCDACLAATLGRPQGSAARWRAAMGELVAAADAVVAPSESALTNVARAQPDARSRAHIIPWGVPVPAVRLGERRAGAGPLRVAMVSVWARAKGAERLPALLSACADLDVEFHLFGATEGASLSALRRSAPRVVIHGAYRRTALAERLVQSDCRIALLASVAAETFSLTLSEVTAVGLPVLASELGALSERVRREELGWLFDPWDPSTLSRALGRLCREPFLVEEARARISSRPVRTEAEMAREHLSLVRDLARTPAPAAGPEIATLLAEYSRGVESAARVSPSFWAGAMDAVRKSDTYRDLRLRKLLPERTRLSIEEALGRWLSRPPR